MVKVGKSEMGALRVSRRKVIDGGVKLIIDYAQFGHMTASTDR